MSEKVAINDFQLYRKGDFVLASPTKEEAEEAFSIIRAKLPKKYIGTHIVWQMSLFGSGAVGMIVDTKYYPGHSHLPSETAAKIYAEFAKNFNKQIDDGQTTFNYIS